MQNRIERVRYMLSSLAPNFLEIEDHSAEHRDHLHGAGEQTHLKIKISSSQFQGLGRLERQRKVLVLVSEEFLKGMHALEIETLTQDDLKDRPQASLQ